MRIVVFGTGGVYEKKKHTLENMSVVVLLDNAKAKQGTYLDGIYIDAPENIGKYQYDYVFLMSDAYIEMREQMLGLGVPEKKIIDRANRGIFRDWKCTNVKRYDTKRLPCRKKRILLYSHQMSLTGAPRVLFNMAKILKNEGYYVELCSSQDGELTYECLLEEIPVSIVQVPEMEYYLDVERVKKEFDLVVVCTACCYGIIKKLNNSNIPVIWWIHEVKYAYATPEWKENKPALGSNIHIYGGGVNAIEVYKRYSGYSDISELLYGVESFEVKTPKDKMADKLVFAIAATVEERKGQDIFMDAVNSHWEKWKDKAEFWMIGKISDEKRSEYSAFNTVKILGQMEYEELLEAYGYIDVMVCPSRRDPMPVVLTEGMMLKKTCIVSEAVGTSKYIMPYKNGLLCRTGDPESLAAAIQWTLDNREKLPEIGEEAYKIYDNVFSAKQFKKNILEIVEKII